MRSRVIETLKQSVGEIGLGCWQLGPDWGGVDDALAERILAEAVECGVTFLDTADVYGSGQSERRIGSFLKKSSARVCVATKIGRFPEPGWPKNYTFPIFQNHVEASLRRLNRDVLDLVQLHCIPTERLRDGAWVEWFDKLKRQGKLRAYGVSVETVEEAEFCCSLENVASLQIIFNIFRQKPTERLLELASQKKKAIIVRLPLASGLLSGRVTEDTEFLPQDHRHYNMDGQMFNVGETFAGLGQHKGSELAQQLKPFVPEDVTMAQMALRWILDHPQVTVVIPGATKVYQIMDNAAVSDIEPLSGDVHAKIKSFYTDHVAKHIRGRY